MTLLLRGPARLCGLLFITCGGLSFTATAQLPYQFDQPTLIAQMPEDLEEISGLGLDPSGQYLMAVQDEEGKIFYLNKKTGRIERSFEFWKEGDYEGVEAVGADIYVVKSTGTVYRVRQPGTAQQTVEKYNGFLNDQFDVEGLGYDARQERLLLACKSLGEAGQGKESEKNIYAFDLRSHEFIPQAVYRIERRKVLDYLAAHPDRAGYDKLSERYGEDNDEFDLRPSGLAVQPGTGDLYVLSSQGKLLIILRPDGGIRHIVKLNKNTYPQPEGICFDTDGTLYIANEARYGQATLYRLPLQTH